MKAIAVNDFGGPGALALLDLAEPDVGPGEVLVKVEYAGVNYMDVYMRSGIYRRSKTYETPLPMVLGMEGAGVIRSCGPGVEGFRAGDPVAWCLSRGAYAEFAVVPAWRLVRIPAGVPAAVAAALMLQGMTAHYLTHSAFPLENGHTCLVHAAAGGVGQLLVQLARLRGARVIATVGSREKAELAAKRGADACILYREDDFLPIVHELTDGKGVDVVYDSVGGDTIARSIRCLRRRGTCIMYGTSSDVVDCIEPLEFAEAGSVFFTRPIWPTIPRMPRRSRGAASPCSRPLPAAGSSSRLTASSRSATRAVPTRPSRGATRAASCCCGSPGDATRAPLATYRGHAQISAGVRGAQARTGGNDSELPVTPLAFRAGRRLKVSQYAGPYAAPAA